MKNLNIKEMQTKLTKGLLDIIVLEFLDQEPMHGYQIITQIRKNYGVYFGPSTIYPLLGLLEKKGCLKSAWSMNSERPRKIYEITRQGKNTLSLSADSLNLICKRMTTDTKMPMQMAASSRVLA